MKQELEIEEFISTEFGRIPKDWRYVSTKKAITFFGGAAFKSSDEVEEGLRWLKISNVGVNRILWDVESFLPWSFLKSYDRYVLHEGDIIMALTRPVLNGKLKIARINSDDSPALLNQRVAKLVISNDCHSDFIYQLLQIPYFAYSMEVRMAGTDPPNIGNGDLYQIKVPLPPYKEQEKIANVLMDWDKAINSVNSIIDNLKLRKKGLMQQIFSGELRLQNPSGKSFPDWKAQKLGHYLKVSKAKNLDLKYGDEDVLSVSGEFGIVNQIEFHGRSFAGASVANYGVVETGDIVYTKSPLKANPYGIIKVNKGVPGIVSTLYAIYKCKPTVNGEFVDYYFQLDDNVNRYLRPLVQKGTKNDMKINNEKVLIDKVLFPSVEEQAVIVDFFKTVDQEITETKNYLETLKTQKKGLMQKLLTGEVRVKI